MGYILFSSENNVFIQAEKTWDGTIEYSYDNKEWKEWEGKWIINNVIYMRGVNNTIITRFPTAWIIKGKNIQCQGNIENLLDYKFVINNVHPKMEKYCFHEMFCHCNTLIEAPQLPFTTLSIGCYWHMFEECTSLTISPMFPNLQIAKDAINQEMFYDCSLQFININNKLYDVNVLKLV